MPLDGTFLSHWLLIYMRIFSHHQQLIYDIRPQPKARKKEKTQLIPSNFFKKERCQYKLAEILEQCKC